MEPVRYDPRRQKALQRPNATPPHTRPTTAHPPSRSANRRSSTPPPARPPFSIQVAPARHIPLRSPARPAQRPDPDLALPSKVDRRTRPARPRPAGGRGHRPLGPGQVGRHRRRRRAPGVVGERGGQGARGVERGGEAGRDGGACAGGGGRCGGRGRGEDVDRRRGDVIGGDCAIGEPGAVQQFCLGWELKGRGGEGGRGRVSYPGRMAPGGVSRVGVVQFIFTYDER